MKLIQQWLAKHQHRQEKFVSLYDMMFDGSDVSYLSFRLSLFNLQVLFHYFSHLIMFYFMYHKLALRTFTVLILVSAIKMLVTAGWWGGLETLRSQVRGAHHSGDKEEVNKIIGFWLVLSAFIALPFFGVALYYTAESYHHYIHHEPAIESIFIAFSFFSMTVQLPLGAYHAGIYGFSRIMRPRFSMILPYLIGVCLLLLSWQQLRQYAILLSIMGEAVTSILLTYYYTAYMYSLYKVAPVKPQRQFFRSRFLALPFFNFLLGAVANIFIMSDALLIVGFYFVAYGSMRMLVFIQIIFLISPLIRASSDWARLFYFDRKQLENDQLSLFITQYEKSVARVASLLGVCFGITAAVSSYLLISPTAGLNTLMMLPFFLMRALIANQQVKAFTYYYFYDVIVSGILMTVSLIGIYTMKISLPEKGGLIALAMIVINAFLKKYRFGCCQKDRYHNLYTNLYYWLSVLCEKSGLVEVYRLTLDAQTTVQQKMTFIRKLISEFNISGDQVCVVGEEPLCLYRQVKDSNSPPANTTLAVLGAGIVRKVERDLVSADGTLSEDARVYAIRQSPIVRVLTEGSLNKHIASPRFSIVIGEVADYFLELFPAAIYYAPDRHLGPDAEPLPYETVRKFNFLIWQYLFQQKGGRSSEVDLSLLFEGGLVRAIFVIPHGDRSVEHFQMVREWREYLHAVNIAESLQRAVPDGKEDVPESRCPVYNV